VQLHADYTFTQWGHRSQQRDGAGEDTWCSHCCQQCSTGCSVGPLA
jgi:hypothetical protein